MHCFRITIAFCFIAFFLSSVGAPATAGEWPQILGPHRSGEADGEKLAPWPAAGPKQLWTQAIGSGYAGPVVEGGKVVVFHRVDDKEQLAAFDGASGKPLWRTDFPASYGGGVNDDNGPRGTPVIHEGQVFAFGAAGDLHCVALADGKEQWSRALYVDYKGDEGYFGAGCSPLVAGDNVLVNVGGKGAGLVGLDRRTGKTAWAVTDEIGSYSSPTLAKIDGKMCAVFVTRFNTVGVDPVDGTVKFRFPFGKRGPTVNAAVPLVNEGAVFVTASYGIGAQLATIRGGIVEKAWANDTSLSSQYNTPVLKDGYFYGIHGREDAGLASLRCIDRATGKIAWQQDEFGCAHAILSDDKILLLKTSGDLVLIEASSKAYRPLAKAHVSDRLTRPLPALAGGKLYVRDLAGGRGSLMCFDLSANK